MIYRIVLDGEDMYDSFNNNKAVLSPNLEMEINTAGSLEFTIGCDHACYDAIRLLKSTIEVYEDDELIWFGRPAEQNNNFRKQKQFYCEGAFAYFNDSIQRPQIMNGISLHLFFKYLIVMHNKQVAEDRQFEIGNITVDDKSIYRKLTYEKTFDAIKTKCLDAEGGYIFCRRVNGINYIDWLKEMPYSSNQPIEFGLNLLDLQTSFDGTSFATCVIPLGATDSESGEPLTIQMVTKGSIVLESDAVDIFGRITTVANFSDIKDPYELYKEGQTFLENTQFNSLMLECTAADLHAQNENYNNFKLGQIVHCYSNPHLIDRNLPISKMSLKLDTAAKQITLGLLPKKTLTKYYNDDATALDQLIDQTDTISDIIGYDPENFEPDEYAWDDWYNEITGPDYDPDYDLGDYSIPEYDTNFDDKYNDLSDRLDDLSDYLGYGDNPQGENILNNLDDRIKELEEHSGSGDSWYPKIWIGTEAQFLNDESNYIRTLDTSPVAGKDYYTFDKTIPGYTKYTLDKFQSGEVYYERYAAKGEFVISFIVDNLPDDEKNRAMRVPSGWEVSETADVNSQE